MRFGSCVLTFCLLLGAGQASAQPVTFDISTNYSGDTLYAGYPGEIRIDVDAGPHEVYGICWTIQWTATSGLYSGVLTHGVNLVYSQYSEGVFASRPFTNTDGEPDTMIIAGISFGGPWEGSHEFARILFTPQDTGTIFIDSAWAPPANRVYAVDAFGTEFPHVWIPGRVVVAPCTFVVGDLNTSGTITLGDIILLVNYVFKMGPAPAPHVKIGDSNCSGTITSADIIYLVNHQGRGGPPPPCPCYNP